MKAAVVMKAYWDMWTHGQRVRLAAAVFMVAGQLEYGITGRLLIHTHTHTHLLAALKPPVRW